jgi:16S rRNA (guanine966-N2)-methyltransferase
MRVIAGLYKGRRIRTVEDLSVRPATDRVKQTLFDMLATRIALEGARVLDLFAGSGSLGIEALSRGAHHVTFVENNEEAARIIEQNLATLGCEESADVYDMDALDYVRSARGRYDLVFADPPYGFEHTEDLPALITNRSLLEPHGYLLIEHASSVRFTSTLGYRAGPEKKFGRTLVTFFRIAQPPATPEHT